VNEQALQGTGRRAIIDIGSNSIRLVVFGGSMRAPVTLYNEKLMAGLGRGVIDTGALAPDAMAMGLAGLDRFRVLLDHMAVDTLRVVATAAVRDASNGAAFLEQVRELGLPVELLSGEQEAMASGLGVISAIPDADGIVADLGGGSLELVRVAGGQVTDRISLPLGILKVPDIRRTGMGKLRRHVERLVAGIPWLASATEKPLYLVGGSWRSLARIHIHHTGFPLAVLGHHEMLPEEAEPLAILLKGMDKAGLKAIPGLPTARAPMVEDAAALLSSLVDSLHPTLLVTCAFGLREGLLYEALDAKTRAQDPLIEGVRFAVASYHRFPGHAEALFDWTEGLFAGESTRLRRLREAACLLLALGWSTNPDFRAQSGEELALQGNWAGVSPAERAVMALALYTGLGGSGPGSEALTRLASPEALERARRWGLAIRLAQRLSGGAPDILRRCPIGWRGDAVSLAIPVPLSALDSPSVRRRFERLGAALGASPMVVTPVMA
jgi:exopolyphosphatase / guanosine-5'-triphosphate,3'-diphosphate pyrophosphatase